MQQWQNIDFINVDNDIFKGDIFNGKFEKLNLRVLLTN